MADPIQEQLPSSGTPAPSPAPSPAPAPSPPPSPSPSPAPASAGTGTGTGAPPAPAFQGVREALAQGYGLDLRQQFPDDHAALAYLANAARMARQYQPVVSEYQQHQQEFQQWMAAKQEEARQQQAQQKQSWWKAPEFDPRWRSQIVRDPATGRMVPAEGADPMVVQKYQQATAHMQDFFDKFAFDPVGTIRPGIEEVVRELAQEMMQQNLGGYQDQQFAQGWVQQNSGWLHARDQGGNVVVDPQSGRPSLSPLGQRFAAYVQQAESSGLQSVQAQRDYALGMVQRDYLYAVHQQQAGGQQPVQQPAQQQPVQQQPGQAAKDSFLQNAAARVPNYGQAAAQTPPRPKNPQELQKTMLAEMAANGYGPGSELPMGNR